ncbi:hypothetical protein TMatcc_000045 [Talaromyces marneffei ATCC 18224]|uniref:Uncharacterized protein n=2 Tax=Talaromyces marneffei TaxID=37727 RepID=B6QPV4_TALMQ|nr:uncharacterized protein EYB26_005140 [Talaromyces marneffei]EEA20072.1 hypothetical protein PMAA_039370 [Talaromyces marneffei ATCC 18224]KAE8549091.1 hypothetical protein EYB25_007606 [Talaromyces marneffei]QGA17469.1 hypothetical protein EYB26_005140 [Talaromyces marneffei]
MKFIRVEDPTNKCPGTVAIKGISGSTTSKLQYQQWHNQQLLLQQQLPAPTEQTLLQAPEQQQEPAEEESMEMREPRARMEVYFSRLRSDDSSRSEANP